MQKASFLYLLIVIALALLGAYHAVAVPSSLTAFIRFSALAAYMLICITLLIGPLTLLWPKSFAQIVEPRRAIGISSSLFVLLHAGLYIAMRLGWSFDYLWGFPMVVTATPALILLFMLTITSADFAIKTLGAGLWKSVQRLNYLAFILVSAHFLLKSNGLPRISASGQGINLAELAMVLLGLATIIFQFWGFLARRARMKEAGAKAAQAEGEGRGTSAA